MSRGIDRRQVLATAAGTLAAMSLKSWAWDQVSPPVSMRFGLVTYLWGQDMPLPSLLEASRAGGVDGLELRTTHAHGVEPSLGKEDRARIKSMIADSGVTLVGLGSDERFCWPEKERLKAAKDRTIEFLQLSHDVGGSGVKVKPDSFRKGVPRDKTIEQIGLALKSLGPIAGGLGQQVRLEVHGSCADPAVIRDIMAIADHPSIVVCWNCNDADLGGEGLEANFKMLRPRFGDTLHVRHLARHAYPYADLFKLLSDTKWNGWILLEARGTLPVDRAAAFKEQRDLFEKQCQAVLVKEPSP
ncbi:MAG: TIM barrel protein [Phycisphaerales bacterium]|nr:TIM barrel protein [Phycisphaerales bacterium]